MKSSFTRLAMALALTAGLMTTSAALAQSQSPAPGSGQAMAMVQQLQEQATQLKQKYGQIMARLQRLTEVAQQNDNTQLLQRVTGLKAKAQAKFTEAMNGITRQMSQYVQTGQGAAGTQLPGNRQTRDVVEGELPPSQWQGAGRTLGQMEGTRIDAEVNTGQMRTQQQGQMEGVSRGRYEDQVITNPELREDIERSGSQP